MIDVKCVKKALVTQRYSREPLFASASSLLQRGSVCALSCMAFSSGAQRPARLLTSLSSGQVSLSPYLHLDAFVIPFKQHFFSEGQVISQQAGIGIIDQ